jgi:AcrR family transcriptional regulator
LAHPQRVEQVLDDLQRIILAEGFANLRIGTLAARLRCSRSTLYRLAPSKDDLVLLVIQRAADASFHGAVAAASEPGLGAAARIKRHLSVSRRYQGLTSETFWRDVREWAPASDLMASVRMRAVVALQEYITQGVGCGEFRSTNATVAANMVLALFSVSHDPDVLKSADISSGQMVDEVQGFLIAGLGKRDCS